jgi:hypothetical protein
MCKLVISVHADVGATCGRMIVKASHGTEGLAHIEVLGRTGRNGQHAGTVIPLDISKCSFGVIYGSSDVPPNLSST